MAPSVVKGSGVPLTDVFKTRLRNIFPRATRCAVSMSDSDASSIAAIPDPASVCACGRALSGHSISRKARPTIAAASPVVSTEEEQDTETDNFLWTPLQGSFTLTPAQIRLPPAILSHSTLHVDFPTQAAATSALTSTKHVEFAPSGGDAHVALALEVPYPANIMFMIFPPVPQESSSGCFSSALTHVSVVDDVGTVML